MSSNREALMQLYERLQTGLSKADAYECLLEIAEVTCLIQARKQSLFWADTFSLAWRTIHKFTCEQNPLVDNACNLQFGILRAWTHAFVKPFVSNLEKSRHHIAPAQRQNFQQKVRFSSRAFKLLIHGVFAPFTLTGAVHDPSCGVKRFLFVDFGHLSKVWFELLHSYRNDTIPEAHTE
ncbi:unnamed protein product [Albugo candida]|uniref:Uncharacterized protein n=1 Tax=Albugo candida TaxID=65357 RepID=A0A024GNM9_9STRA|nr:unnamed protein product [Albugo candida]|eukprot:CCI48390.1 unnamed protein product [Albugo candida]